MRPPTSSRPLSASASARSAPEPSADGLSDAEFARLIDRLGPFESRPRLALAVSGGPDSLALALLTSRWVTARGGALIGITVDHRLRPGSAAEAATVGVRLARLGIGHVVLPWTGAKPATGLQAAAREARYRLLHTFCRERRILHLLLAHQEDDQAETVVLRRAAGSGARGLAGMPAVVEGEGLRTLRPLLGVPKARLVATLRTAGLPFLDDPWNRSPAFARGRLRLGGRVSRESASVGHGARRAAMDRRLAAWLVQHARPDPLGFIDLERAALLAAAPEMAAEAVRRVLQTVGGRPYPPATASLDGLLRRLRVNAPGTLGGVLVRPAADRIRCVREARAAPSPPRPLAGGVWFDHRFLITSRRPDAGLFVAALGERGWLERRRLDQVRPPRPVERAVGESLPALLRDGRLVAVPQLGLAAADGPALDQIAIRFRPRHPLLGAPFGVLDDGRGGKLLR